VSHGHTISEALLAVLISTMSLQGGYMFGLSCRDLLGQALSRLHVAPSKRV
jgi:hypothetical protein